jgi:hypothetical protein
MQRADVGERRAHHIVAEAVVRADGENGPFAIARKSHPSSLELVALNAYEASALFTVSSFEHNNVFAALLQVYRLVRLPSSEDAAQFTVWRGSESCYASLRVHMRDFPRLVEVFGSSLDPGVWKKFLEGLGPEMCKEPKKLELCPSDANFAGGQSTCVRGRLHRIPAAYQVNKWTGRFYDKDGIFDFRHRLEEQPNPSRCQGERCFQTVELYTWERGRVREVEEERDRAGAHRMLLPYHSSGESMTDGCTTTIDAVSSDSGWTVFVERLQELEANGYLLGAESRSKTIFMWINLGQFETRGPGGHAHVHVATRDQWEAKKFKHLAGDRWLCVNCSDNLFDIPYFGRLWTMIVACSTMMSMEAFV